MAAESGLTPFAQLWNDALHDYAAEAEIPLSDIPHPKDVDELITSLERRHTDFDRESKQGEAFTNCLKGALVPFEFLNNMFGGAAGLAFPPSSQILGAVSVLIDAGKNVTDAFDALDALFQKLAGFTKRLRPLTRPLEKLPAEFEEILRAVLVSMLGICALATKRTYHPEEADIKHARFHRLVRTTKMYSVEYIRQLFLGKDKAIREKVDELERLIDEEQKMTIALTKEDTTIIRRVAFDIKGLNIDVRDITSKIRIITTENNVILRELGTTVNETNEIAKGLRSTTAATDAKADLLVAGQRDLRADVSTRLDRFEKIAQSLRAEGNSAQSSAPGAKSKTGITKDMKQSGRLKELLKPSVVNMDHFHRMKTDRLPGTGDWILSNDTVKQWFKGKDGVIWITGVSGTGKTFLATRIVEELLEQHKQGLHDLSRVSVAYFFCKSRIKELKDPCDLLRTAAFQIAQNDQVYSKYIFDQGNEHTLDDLDFQKLWKLLYLDYFKDTRSKAYLVIDAIEECDADALEAMYSALQATYSGEEQVWSLNLQVALLTQSHVSDRLGKMLGENHSHVSLQQSWSREDVQRFIHNRLSSAWSGKLVPGHLHADVEAAISASAKGNFLWASLVVEELTSLSREDSIREALRCLPKDLDAAMLLILSRLSRDLSGQDLDDLNDILAWVVCSHMSLSVRDLDALLCIRQPDGARVVDLEERLQDRFKSLFVLSKDEPVTSRVLRDRMQRGEVEDSHVAERALPLDGALDTDSSFALQADGAKSQEVTKSSGKLDLETAFQHRLDEMGWTNVSLGHSLVGSFIQKRIVQEGVVGFATDKMYVKVLLSSLDALCNTGSSHSAQTVEAAFAYIAGFLPDHLMDVSISDVDAATKAHVAKRLITILRDEAINTRWVLHAESALPEKFADNEDFIGILHAWLNDPEVLDQLDREQREWVSRAQQSRFEPYLRQTALTYARRWLEHRTGDIDAQYGFLDMFWCKFVSHAGEAQADAQHSDGGLSGASADRILLVARWADFEETAFWHSRVAYALRTANQLEAAVQHYETAKTLDSTDALITSGLALTYWQQKQFSKAIASMKEAVDLHGPNMADGVSTGNPDTDMQTYYVWDVQELANFYSTQDQPAEAIRTHESILTDWEHATDKMWEDTTISAIALISVATECGDYSAAVDMLQRMVEHERAQDVSTPWFGFVYQYFLQRGTQPTRVAYETGRFDVLERFWKQALSSSVRWGESGEPAAVRYYWAVGILQIQPARLDEAVNLLRDVVSDVEIAFRSSSWYWLREQAELELARVYLNKAIVAREEDRWHDVGTYATELVSLCRQDKDQEGGGKLSLSTRDCTLVLAAWDRINGRSARAKYCAREIMRIGVDMLSDTDPENDQWAWILVGNCCLVTGDLARAAVIYGFEGQIVAYGNSVTKEPQAVNDVLNVGTNSADSVDMPAPSTNAEAETTLGAQQTADVPTPKAAIQANDHVVKEHASSANRTLNPGVERPSSEDTVSLDTVPSHSHDGVLRPTQETKFDGERSRSVDAGEAAAGDVSSTAKSMEKTAIRETYPQSSLDSCPANAQDDKPRQESSNTVNDEAQVAPADADAIWYSCDGPCFKTIPCKDVVYRCTYCIQDFCKACHELISADKAKWTTCNSVHVRVALEGSSEKWSKGKLKVGDDFVDFKVWLEELKVDWEL